MATFTVWYRSTTLYGADIEAETAEEAIRIAEDMDGSEFYEDTFTGDWELYEICDEEGNTYDKHTGEKEIY